MNAERIKEIQGQTAYPNSVSVQQALLKVWNECEQVHLKDNNKIDVSQQRELFDAILDFTEELPMVSEDYFRDILWAKFNKH